MKKAYFLGIAVLLALVMVSCDFFAGHADNDDPSVSYTLTPDGSTLLSVTMRLDGQGGVDRKMSRALTANLAKTGHDFFEVVFYAPNSTEDHYTTARASWEIGEPAVISNVPRGGTSGIDYGAATPTGMGDGAAILFVGRKQDKALLAVGLLTEVDGTPSNTTVKADSQTVTFKVAALTAGAGFTATASSLLTAAEDATDKSNTANISAANTTLRTASYKDGGTSYLFPVYLLPTGETIAASYTLDCNDPSGIDDYLPGIISPNNGNDNKAEVRFPRFLTLSGGHKELRAGALSTKVMITNNDTSTAGALENPITMEIDTKGTADVEGLISFSFDIPVYAITNTPISGVPGSIAWHIKPGFGPNYYTLDNGAGSAGGALLLGVGDQIPLNELEVLTGWID